MTASGVDVTPGLCRQALTRWNSSFKWSAMALTQLRMLEQIQPSTNHYLKISHILILVLNLAFLKHEFAGASLPNIKLYKKHAQNLFLTDSA